MIDAISYFEKAVITSIILHKNEGEIFAATDQEDFLHYPHVYEALREMWRRYGRVDEVTVKSLAGEVKEDCEICLAQRVNPSDGLIYARQLKESNAMLESLRLANEIISGDYSYYEMQNKVNEISKRMNMSTGTKSMSMDEAVEYFIEKKQTPKKYIHTGYSMIDRHTYIDRGDYIIIGARPSSGKTALSLNLAVNIAKAGYKVVFFSLETSNEKLADRMWSSVALIDFDAVKKQELMPDDWAKVAKATDFIKKLPLEFVETTGQTVEWIQAEAIRRGADVIFVDYIGQVRAEGNGRYEKMTNISIGLHEMAQRNKITVFGLSQLNREGALKAPSMEDLRESGQIEQDADAIMLIHPMLNEKDRSHTPTNIIIAKNKEGEKGIVQTTFHGKVQRFYEVVNR